MVRRFYDFILSLAATRHAEKVLAAISFFESSVLPTPPDMLLIPMVLAQRGKWARYAFICTLSSVAGALLGYAIGAFLYTAIGQPILAFYGKADAFQDIADWYDRWGGWGILFGAVTPFPYKILTIFSGATGLNLAVFISASLVGRGARFLFSSWLVYRFGSPIKIFLEKNLTVICIFFMLLFVIGFAIFYCIIQD